MGSIVSGKCGAGPVARGFSTFAGDSGDHKHYFLLPDSLNTLNASFVQNREERRNFAAHDGLKKTRDAAMSIIEKRYGTLPARISFSGSTGGRESFFVVQRWPNDYDGVVGAYAGWDQMELDLGSFAYPRPCTQRAAFCRSRSNFATEQRTIQPVWVSRFFLIGDEYSNALRFDTTTGGRFSGDLVPHSETSDVSDADLNVCANAAANSRPVLQDCSGQDE